MDGTIIDSSDWNSNVAADLSGALTQSISKDGQTVYTGNQSMGNNKITSLQAGALATDAANLGQVSAAAYQMGVVGGTGDAITLSVSPVISAYAAGQEFWFVSTAANTTAVTVAVSGLATKDVHANGVALVANDIVSGRLYGIKYDGTQFQLLTSHATQLHPADLAPNASTGAVRAVVGTSDTILATDRGKLVTFSNGSPIAVTLPQATGDFVSPFFFTATNLGAGLVTITPTTSTINGAATLTISEGQSSLIYSDSTNYQIARNTFTQTFQAGYLYNLGISNAADTEHDITVGTGECRDAADAYDIVLSGALTKRIDANWVVGTNQGGLFSGSVANATWYHVFVIRRSDTGVVDAGFDTSLTAANIPSPYDAYRRLGSVLTDGSANILQFVQTGNEFLYNSATPPLSVDVTNLDTTSTLYTVATPLGLTTEAILNTLVTAGSQRIVLIQSPLVATQAASATVSPLANIGLQGTNNDTRMVRVRTNTSSQIRAVSSNSSTTLRVATLGWVDNR